MYGYAALENATLASSSSDSSTMSASSAPAATSTASSASAAAVPHSGHCDDDSVKIGAGVGVPLGVVALMAVAWALWERRKGLKSRSAAITGGGDQSAVVAGGGNQPSVIAGGGNQLAVTAVGDQYPYYHQQPVYPDYYTKLQDQSGQVGMQPAQQALGPMAELQQARGPMAELQHTQRTWGPMAELPNQARPAEMMER